jgi:hypothetical protein
VTRADNNDIGSPAPVMVTPGAHEMAAMRSKACARRSHSGNS